MLSHEYRLPAIIKLSPARYYKTQLFSIKYAPNQMSVSRFAFIVRKATDKRAVVRNRIRRVFRSCIEELLEEVTVGYDMLFFLEKGIMDSTRDELLKEVKKTLEAKGLLSKG
jgi:ribonuclease P protein component